MINVKKIVTVGALFVLLAQSFAMQAMRRQLYTAYYKGDTSTVESLLEAGTDVNTENSIGFTPLHFACLRGHIEIVESLLEAGTDVNIQDKKGETPLHFACLRGHIEIVESLLEAGTDVNIQDKKGETPLHFACLRGHIEVVESLFKVGADVNATDKDYSTPLHFACDRGHIEVVRLLFQLGADVNAKDNDGKTPLHFAFLRGHIEVVKLLFANGAQVNHDTLDGVGIQERRQERRRLVSDVDRFQQAPNKLEFVLEYVWNDQEDDDIFQYVSEDAKEFIKIACSASLAQMLKGEIQIEDALFYKLYQDAPNILSETFEVKSLQVDDLMDCIIEKTNICLTQQMQEKYLWLTKQMQERLAEYKNLLINTSERFEFLKQQYTDRWTTISTNDRELKMPSFLGLQIMSQQLVEEIEEEEEGE